MRERNESQIVTDITIYGATSFVARHVLNYLVEVGPTLLGNKNNTTSTGSSSPSSSSSLSLLKITLAGRNETKLNKVLENCLLKSIPSPVFKLDIFIADSNNHGALKRMANRSRIILNCAGPFESYSSGVVGACAETGCDYVDITGEVQWVGDMRVKYGSTSAKTGSRIISLCGFDSIPSDMAIYAAVQALRAERITAEIETARTWHACMGMAGGGTLATMKQMQINIGKCLISDTTGKPRRVPLLAFDPLVLSHPTSVRFNPDYEPTRNNMAWKEWLNLLPFPHTIFQQGVSIPFFMAIANAKVVNASAVALGYGPTKFQGYQERWLPLGFKLTLGFGLFSTIPSLIILWFTSVSALIIKLPIIGDFLLGILAPPGTGASDTMCAKGYAQVYAEVKTAPLPPSNSNKNMVSCANAFLEFQGDPGNYVTAQCVVESALCLLLNRKELPPRSKDGFGTPAELLGNVLLKRLQTTTVRPVKLKTNVRARERDHEYKLYL